MKTTAYDYETKRPLTEARSIHEAIESSLLNYMGDQLGWTPEACQERVRLEEERAIPKTVLAALQSSGWRFSGAKVLDIGAGQGALVLELLERGADAYGLEPGDEFADLARRRLQDAGENPARIVVAPGEKLPFPDNTFDYAISLQVLEHVVAAGPILREIQRVLKPGGRAYVSCENYLSLREQHYRVPWLPMLPKPLGALYLRALGRNPSFFDKYVYHRTYPEVWKTAEAAGFRNVSHDWMFASLRATGRISKSKLGRTVRVIVRVLPALIVEPLLRVLLHLRDVGRVGVRVQLFKPKLTS